MPCGCPTDYTTVLFGLTDKSYLSTTVNDVNANVSSRRGTWDHMEMFSPLRESMYTFQACNKKY